MADATFNTTNGQTIERELLLLYLNTGTHAIPLWSPIGKRVADSSEELDWGKETKTDIFGQTYTSLKKPTISQSFEPCELDSGDVAQVKLWNLAIKDQDIAGLASLEMLLVHCYAGTAGTAMIAERYEACSVEVTGLGGAGGGTIGMPITVTFGGTRTVGTASITGGVVTFSEPT